MEKTVWTYTALAKKAMALAASNPNEFFQLGEQGTKDIIRGMKVCWSGGTDSRFDLYGLRRRKGGYEVDHVAWIFGNKRNGKWYTTWVPILKPSKYRKGEVAKHFPISLPDGICGNGNTKPCLFHRIDGTVVALGHWVGGRKDQCGKPSRHICFDDETGELLSDDQWRDMRLDFAMGHRYYELEWSPDAAPTTREWIDSFQSIPAVDLKLVTERALRACKVGLDLMADYPAIKMLLLKPAEASDQIFKKRFLPNGQSAIRVDVGLKAKWYMPTVVLYWPNGLYCNALTHWASVNMTVDPTEQKLMVQDHGLPDDMQFPQRTKIGVLHVWMSAQEIQATVSSKFVLDSLPML